MDNKRTEVIFTEEGKTAHSQNENFAFVFDPERNKLVIGEEGESHRMLFWLSRYPFRHKMVMPIREYLPQGIRDYLRTQITKLDTSHLTRYLKGNFYVQENRIKVWVDPEQPQLFLANQKRFFRAFGRLGMKKVPVVNIHGKEIGRTY